MGSTALSPNTPAPPPSPSLPGQSSEAPRLSPSQLAFRKDPDGFLERLNARAKSLFQDGYSVRASGASHAFVVSHTAPKDGKVSEYLVCPLQETCTCPFFARQAAGEHLGEDGALILCKHLLGLSELVRETRGKLASEKNLEALCALCRPWMETVSLKLDLKREARSVDQTHPPIHGHHERMTPQ